MDEEGQMSNKERVLALESVLGLKTQGRIKWVTAAFISALLVMLSVLVANAFEIDTGSQDWKVRWDNTLKYSAAFRLVDQNKDLLTNINADDGDRNFNRGLISNRLDDLSELDIAYRNKFGFRASAAGWVDQVYNVDNANNSPATFNGFGSNDEFPSATADLHGRRVEILDAFVWGNGSLGKMPASFKLGRHTLMWGESLFFASNGIAYGQAPIDFIKALGVPGTQAKELFMPVGQYSGLIQLSANLSVAGFLDFEWRRSRAPASGSYFSDADMIDAGGKRILLGPNLPGMPAPALFRGKDLGAGNETDQFGQGDFGQGGLDIRYRSEKLDTEFGLYWYRYNEKSPYWMYIKPGLITTPMGPVVIDPSIVDLSKGKVGQYYMVFPEGIHMLGASFSTQFGPVNVAGELSGRINTPLISSVQTVLPGMVADNNDHPLYAVGNTLHGNLSATYLLGPGPMIGSFRLWQGGDILGEFAWQYLIDTTKNPGALDPTRDDFATGIRVLFEPTYYQVFPGIDVVVPIGLGYVPAGRSPVDLKFNGSDGDQAGDVNVGLKVTYNNLWNIGLTYTNYFGGSGAQHLNDRDFISLYVQRTF
jgi:hypothetical protein